MDYNKDSEVFHDYLRRIKDPKEDRCWMCHKTPDKIRQEYFEYMKHPDERYEDIEIDDIAIMTYKTKKPICAACYFDIKRNTELIQEILERPEDEIWS